MGKKYGSLMEFALFGGEDEEIDLETLVATKKKTKSASEGAKNTEQSLQPDT